MDLTPPFSRAGDQPNGWWWVLYYAYYYNSKFGSEKIKYYSFPVKIVTILPETTSCAGSRGSHFRLPFPFYRETGTIRSRKRREIP
jgi:hypothetical protein